MGIPGLFSYICQNYPQVVITIKKSNIKQTLQRENKCDHIYIDTNALIHPCAQFVFNYGNNKRWMDPFASLTYEQKIEKLLEKVCETLLDVYHLFAPAKSFVIAVDGVAPFSKQMQQRQRRYLAAKEIKDRAFDSNIISPGTPFMFRLHLKLLTFVKVLKKKEINVVYSSYLEPGEGEHKILDRIRNLSSEKNCRNDNHYIYGPDGDLLVLGLTLPCEHIFIAREDMRDLTLCNIVDVGKLRRVIICATYKSQLNATSAILPQKQFLKDFVMVCSIFGNDFLPRIQMFSRLSQGLDYVLSKWHISGWRNFNIVSGGHDKIMIRLFLCVFGTLAQDEYNFLQEQLDNTGLLEDKFINNTMLKSSKNGVLDFEMYKQNYYKKFFGDDEKITNEQIRRVCYEYIKTLIWIGVYYMHGIQYCSWKWRYSYFYAPLMCDLFEYIKTIDENETNVFGFEKDYPIDPFLQLLYVLPYTSKKNLPKGFRYIFRDELNFPSEFHIDYEGKLRDHEAVIKINFPNTQVIEEKYNIIKNNLPKQYPRNALKN